MWAGGPWMIKKRKYFGKPKCSKEKSVKNKSYNFLQLALSKMPKNNTVI